MSEDALKVVADLLLDSLCKALAVRPNPPKLCCLRYGTSVTQDIEPDDVCCDGLGYVRIGDMWPSSESFPEPDTGYNDCFGTAWAVDLEMGVLRCGGDAGDCGKWNEGTSQHISDRMAMAEALRLFKQRLERENLYYAFVPGQGAPIENEGQCSGATQPVTVQIPGPGCV